MAARGLQKQLLGVFAAMGGGLVACTVLAVRWGISFRHEAWFLVGLTTLALAGTVAVTATIVAGLLRDDEADRADRNRFAARWSDRVGPLMTGVIGVGILAASSGIDWGWGYLPVGLLAACSMTFALLLQREQARALWGLLLVTVAAVAIGAVGLPSTARLRVAEPEIIAEGTQILAGEAPTGAGSYRFVDSFVHRGCAVMITQETMLFSQYGLAYCETAPWELGALSHEFGQVYRYSFTD